MTNHYDDDINALKDYNDFIGDLMKENQRLKADSVAGWRACIDHIIRPDSPCPVCVHEQLRGALEECRDQLVWYTKQHGPGASTNVVLTEANRLLGAGR
jgi:hypothetical protein